MPKQSLSGQRFGTIDELVLNTDGSLTVHMRDEQFHVRNPKMVKRAYDWMLRKLHRSQSIELHFYLDGYELHSWQ